MSRRTLLALGLGSGGLVTLGIGGVLFWRHLGAPQVIQEMDEITFTVTWSPDSQSFAAGDAAGTVAVWAINGKVVYSQQKVDGFSVTSIAWSPDGRYLVVGGDSFAHLWQAQSGRALATYNVADRSFAWSPDSTRIASGSESGEIQIWDPGNGRVLLTLQTGQGNEGINSPVTSIAWSPDGTSLATLGSQASETAAVWNVPTGKATTLPFIRHMTNPVYEGVRAIGWSPDGMQIAAGYADGTGTGRIVLWSQHEQKGTWEYIASASAHFQAVNGIAWSPDNTCFVSVGEDNKVQVWSASNGARIDTYTSDWWGGTPDWWGETETYAIKAVAWSPDGKYLLTGDTVGQVLLWKIHRNR